MVWGHHMFGLLPASMYFINEFDCHRLTANGVWILSKYSFTGALPTAVRSEKNVC